jgi:hypothetical protein
MKNLLNKWPKIKPVIPHIYFICILLAISLPNPHPNGQYILILIVPLFYQILYRKDLGNIILGTFFLIASAYISLAYLSDVYKIEAMYQNIDFVVVGGLFVIANLIMSFWLTGRFTETTVL